MNNQSYWIIGAGRFGRLACERLLSYRPSAHIRVVDHESDSVPSGTALVIEDAAAFLRDNLGPRTNAWIVPAVPLHLAYEWLAEELIRKRGFHQEAVPDDLLPALPNPCRGPEGQVYLSNANFRCPNDCPEPKTICTHTGQSRPLVMHTFLSNLVFEDYTSVVIRSRQLAPGVGGYQASTLWDLSNLIRSRDDKFLFSTSCKCHAVINAFSLA